MTKVKREARPGARASNRHIETVIYRASRHAESTNNNNNNDTDYDFNDNLRIMRLFHIISLYFSTFVHSIVTVKNTVIIFIYFYAYEDTHTHRHTHSHKFHCHL